MISLEDLHSLVKDVWLTRHNAELEEERSARRKGRPKSVKELKLEEIKMREMEEYRVGMGNIFLLSSSTFCSPYVIIRRPRLDASKKRSTIQAMGPEGFGLHQTTSFYQNIP